jgi:hypothetical protein
MEEIVKANEKKEVEKEEPKDKIIKEQGQDDKVPKKEKAKEPKEPMSPEKKNKITIISIIVLVVVIILATIFYIFGVKKPREEALVGYTSVMEQYNADIDNYNQIVVEYNEKANSTISENETFTATIDEAQKVIDSGDVPYEAEKMTTLSNTLKNARNSKVENPNIYEKKSYVELDEALSKSSASVINEATISLNDEMLNIEDETSKVTQANNEIVVPDYSKTIAEIADEVELLEQSYAIQKQITNPEQDWVIEKLNNVGNIANIAYATEDNDPNGKLGKDGGYTAQIYFSSSLLGTEAIAGNNLIEEGTNAGGSIEVYRTVEDAESRNSYLGSFDGSIFDSGKHKVLGTMVVRVSTDLTATKQESFINEIISALIEP